jgi:hypothetical protein
VIADQTNHKKFFESVAKQHFQKILGLGLSLKRCKYKTQKSASTRQRLVQIMSLFFKKTNSVRQA